MRTAARAAFWAVSGFLLVCSVVALIQAFIHLAVVIGTHR